MVIGNIGLHEDVLPEDYLELTSGSVVKNLQDLVNALKKMKSDDFLLHVTRSRNDFAEWILEAYDNERLTQKILKTREKSRIIKILSSALKDSKKVGLIDLPKSKKNVLKDLERVSYGI